MSETDFEGDPKFTITPKETPKLEIKPKATTGEVKPLHPETISQIFIIRGRRISFTHQRTPANCGPLSVGNMVKALEATNERFNGPANFPTTSKGIRQLLSTDPILRTTVFGRRSSQDIKQDSRALETGHIASLIKKLAAESNIEITGDRFTPTSGFPANQISPIIRQSDFLLHTEHYHYTAFVRLDDHTWLHLDSMVPAPVEIDQQTLEHNLQDEIDGDRTKKISYFMGGKVVDNKIPITEKGPQIVITPKEPEAPPQLTITRKK